MPLPLNPLLFPGTALRGVLAHDGFTTTQGFTAAKVLAAVKQGVARFGTTDGERLICQLPPTPSLTPKCD